MLHERNIEPVVTTQSTQHHTQNSHSMASSADHAAARIGGLVAQICAGTGNHRELARELASVVIPELNKYMGAATSKKLKLPKNSIMLLYVRIPLHVPTVTCLQSLACSHLLVCLNTNSIASGTNKQASID